MKQRIDRDIPGLGRVCIRTRARSTKEHDARVALFNRLVEAGQTDVIQMLTKPKHQGGISWVELRAAQRKKRLHSDSLAADVALVRLLWDEANKAGAFSATLPRMGKAASTR